MLNFKNFSLNENKSKINEIIKFKPLVDFIFDEIIKENKKLYKYDSWLSKIFKNSFINFLLNREDYIKLYHKVNFDILNKMIKDNNFNDEQLKKTKELFDQFIKTKSIIINNNTYKPKDAILYIVDWLVSPIRKEIIELNKIKTIEEAYIESDKWHKNIQIKDDIEIENIEKYEEEKNHTLLLYFDDGFYWVDLNTSSCREEAEAMGHCGTTNYGDTLYSLRKSGQPHVTAAVGGNNNEIIFQMKGKQNTKPSEKYYKYIIELLSYPNVSDNVKVINDFHKIEKIESEYNSSEDFNIADLDVEEIIKLNEKNPDLLKNNTNYKLKYSLYKKGILNKHDILSNFEDVKNINDEVVWVLDDWSCFDNEYLFYDKFMYKHFYNVYIYGDYDMDYSYYPSDFLISDIIDVFNEETLEMIKKYLVENKIHIINSSGNKELLTNDNMEIVKKSRDYNLIFNVFENDDDYNLNDYLISMEKKDVDYELSDDEIYYILKRVYASAYSDDAYNVMYDDILKQIGKDIGNIILKDKIYIKLNLPYICELLDNDENKDSNARYKKLSYVIENLYVDSDLRLEYYEPNYGWYGSVDTKSFNETLGMFI